MFGKAVRENIPSGPVKDALSGTWLGHAVHPMLTDVVIGSFAGASVLDLTLGEAATEARQRLIGLGLVAYLPTAAAGVNDWADTEPVNDAVRRVGLLHAAGNAAAALLFAASRRARRRKGGRRGSGLSLAGVLVLMGG